ncbi:hypothetical protein [Amycolatopsis orientalis]|uniref:hypothetical protein n=1 Tax=Amycolatopsis orientalis TaxID=31958 RepID=UPI0013A07E17|nr:hypothetical protein [Amycolatopsis orientalis]
MNPAEDGVHTLRAVRKPVFEQDLHMTEAGGAQHFGEYRKASPPRTDFTMVFGHLVGDSRMPGEFHENAFVPKFFSQVIRSLTDRQATLPRAVTATWPSTLLREGKRHSSGL